MHLLLLLLRLLLFAPSSKPLALCSPAEPLSSLPSRAHREYCTPTDPLEAPTFESRLLAAAATNFSLAAEPTEAISPLISRIREMLKINQNNEIRSIVSGK